MLEIQKLDEVLRVKIKEEKKDLYLNLELYLRQLVEEFCF